MDLRVLQSFLRIADLGSLAGAAVVLNQTQPTLSRQIAALEREVGAPLFVRQRRGLSLTPAGVLFRERAAQALQTLDQAKAEITARAEEPSGTVSLGLPPSLLSVLSGPVVDRLARRHPRVLLHVHEAISQNLESLMSREEVDLAVLISDRRVLRHASLEALAREPLMLVGPVGAEVIAAGRPVPVEALAGLPWLSYRPPNWFRLVVEGALRRRRLAPQVVAELESLPLMLDLIARGLGYTVMPPSALVASGSRLARAPVRGLSVTWTLAINRDRAARPAVRTLAAMIRDQAAALIRQRRWQPPHRPA